MALEFFELVFLTLYLKVFPWDHFPYDAIIRGHFLNFKQDTHFLLIIFETVDSLIENKRPMVLSEQLLVFLNSKIH